MAEEIKTVNYSDENIIKKNVKLFGNCEKHIKYRLH